MLARHGAFYKGEMWLVSHRELRMNKRVRAVFDFLAQTLGEDGA